MYSVVCDTNVVSDLRTGGTRCGSIPLLTTAVKLISVVTAAELLSGAISANWGERRVAELEATIRAYPQLPVDEETGRAWAELNAECRRLGRNVHDNDLWIAATARRIDAAVVSLDGDFARVPGIRLIDASGAERVTA